MSVANTEKNMSMSLDMIKSHKPEVIGINDCLQAAVCIPIIKETSGPAILLKNVLLQYRISQVTYAFREA